MDPRQRYEDDEELYRVVLESFKAELTTAFVANIVSYDATTGLCVVQPGIKGIQFLSDGTAKFITPTVIADIPVVFQRTGTVGLTLPVQKDDPCLVVINSRCIDSWYQSGGIQPPARLHLNNIDDGFALVGPFTRPTQWTNVSATTAQLRSMDGSTSIELDPAGQIVNVHAPGGMNITAPLLTINGNVKINGTLEVSQTIHAAQTIKSDVDVLSQTVSGHAHVHGGVTSGGSATAPPTP